MRSAVVRLLLPVLMMPAAVSWAYEPEELTCGNQFETPDKINQCLAEAVAQAERDVEAVRQTLLKALDEARAKLLARGAAAMERADAIIERAQQAWRDYRDANCRYYESAYAPVSTPGTEQVVCRLRMTRARFRELEDERSFWVYKFREPEWPPAGT